MNKRTVVVSAFPCCGKTYAFKHYQNKYKILDSDSSQFSWIWETEWEDDYEKGCVPVKVKKRNPDFPKNYVEYIKEKIGEVDIIFVSSHLQVRQALEEADLRYCTVYPKENMLNEWVGRMYRRGDNKNFIQFQIEHWEKFMRNIIFEPYGFGLWRLGNNEYLNVDFLYNW